jgi:hypothetical protein
VFPRSSHAVARPARWPEALLVALLTAASLAPAVAAGTRDLGYQYLSPSPGSRLVSPWNNIVLRPGGAIDAATVAASALTVSGTRSGAHAGRLVLSDDGRTLVFNPDRPFALGEEVTVRLGGGVRTRDGAGLLPLSFGFTIAAADPRQQPRHVPDETTGDRSFVERRLAPAAGGRSPSPEVVPQAGDSGPPGMPPVKLMVSSGPEPGDVFFAPFGAGIPGGHLMIYDNAGMPVFYRRLPVTAFDFKMQPGGLLTYYGDGNAFWGLDSSYAVVDSFRTRNGYTADVHDLQVLPDGHALLLSYDVEPVRMDSVVPGGSPNAKVVGLIVQEIDQAKDVVFQWRSWDHFEILDTDSCLINVRDTLVDYVHGNAVELDSDGNLLISARAMNEITKIDRATGEVIWRLGLHAKHNQFTFVNDTRGFSGQHDIRRLANGHITLFDNGNCTSPNYSRGLEYELDEVNKTATLVWEDRGTPDIFGPFMGNVQREASGSTMLGWGGTGNDPKLTEIHADGSIAYALGFQNPFRWTYRAFRFPWQTTRFVVNPADHDFGAVEVGSTDSVALAIHNGSTSPVTITSILHHVPAFVVSTALPLTIDPGATATVFVTFDPPDSGRFADTLYVRSVNDSELVAQAVSVRGTAQATGFGVDDFRAYEGQSRAKLFYFEVRIPAVQTFDVSLQFETRDGTATLADTDYVYTSGSATIPAGDSSTLIGVLVRGDHKVEPDEVFYLVLSHPVGLPIDRYQASGTIVDDDLYAGVTEPPGIPIEFALDPGQPNPAHGRVTLRYDLPRPSRVTLELFDASGRRVASLVDGFRPAGRYEMSWAPKSRSPGLFFCRMRAGSFEATRKLVIVE